MSNNVPITFNPRVNQFDEIEFLDGGGLRHPTAAPGEAAWVNDQGGKLCALRFSCPCGCKDLISVPVWEGAWKWDGNLEAPTLSPSIQKLTGCRWHGYLKKGVFERC